LPTKSLTKSGAASAAYTTQEPVDESWLRREHGDERGPRFSLLEVLLAHQSFVGQRAADRGGGALQWRPLLVDRCPDLANTGAILEADRVAAEATR
jgi:hypothetical protein